MKSLWWTRCIRMGAMSLVGLTTFVARGADDAPKNPPKPGIELEVDTEAGDILLGQPLQRIAIPGPGERVFLARPKMSEFWLGLDCAPCSAALRSHLKIDGEHGLLIESVMPESPAAKAGIEQHDVLLSVNEADLRDIAHLMQLLDESKGNELKCKIVRKGEANTIAVTPEKRPAARLPEAGLRVDADAKAFEAIRDQLGKAGMPMRMHFFHPGMLVPQNAEVMPVPDNLHVHVDKQGGKPAKIVVERGDDRWETTEDKLADLPDDVRPHVETLLGRMPLPKFDVQIDRQPAPTTLPFPLPPSGEIGERVEKRLQEMSERMEEMRKHLDEIRAERQERREDRREAP